MHLLFGRDEQGIGMEGIFAVRAGQRQQFANTQQVPTPEAVPANDDADLSPGRRLEGTPQPVHLSLLTFKFVTTICLSRCIRGSK